MLAARFLLLLTALYLAACGMEEGAPPSKVSERPQRVVSLDYCADQYVLRLADRAQILAVSPDAGRDFSYMRRAAQGLPTVRPIAEDVLSLKPDLIVRAYGGGPDAAAFFARAGVAVLQVGWASSIDGAGLGAIPRVVQDMADGLGQSERGAALVADYQRRLAALKPAATHARTLYMTPAGVTSGPGSLVHQMLVAAGLENFQEAEGWRPLPLERLVYEQPDMIAAAFFSSILNKPHAWSAAAHPVARKQLKNQPVVPLDGAWTACGGWFILDAIEALSKGAT